jgi:phasin family protein
MSDPFSTDFTRLFEQMKVPGVDMQQMIASQRKNLEAITRANQLALEGVQRVAQQQADAVRQFASELADMAKDVAAESGPAEKAARQTDLVKASFEKTLAHMRELSETIATSNTQAADVISKRVSEALGELKDAIQKSKSTS